ncbi:hypothetical protein STSP2_00584 [Anaerohalosphaera lusitana]|uniref:Uncharacterized protein n=1 Tax=Anaerohalosphaera lusitana TaxID=1936003 RepID=A0A1U9NI36_9BACT|nr:hypothetical protein [Anaerohalosphaera lusitana]AQT67437.1 hypothetical protein STSP2_00584 [Anaerohalosphaera lusitana]
MRRLPLILILCVIGFVLIYIALRTDIFTRHKSKQAISREEYLARLNKPDISVEKLINEIEYATDDWQERYRNQLDYYLSRRYARLIAFLVEQMAEEGHFRLRFDEEWRKAIYEDHKPYKMEDPFDIEPIWRYTGKRTCFEVLKEDYGPGNESILQAVREEIADCSEKQCKPHFIYFLLKLFNEKLKADRYVYTDDDGAIIQVFNKYRTYRAEYVYQDIQRLLEIYKQYEKWPKIRNEVYFAILFVTLDFDLRDELLQEVDDHGLISAYQMLDSYKDQIWQKSKIMQ